MAERIAEAVAESGLAGMAYAAVEALAQKRRPELERLRASLPAKIADARARTEALAEQAARASGRARQVTEERFRVAADELAAHERALLETERRLYALEGRRIELAWVANALANFARVWDALTPANRGRLLRALVERVSVEEDSGRVEVHLFDFVALGGGGDDERLEAAE